MAHIAEWLKNLDQKLNPPGCETVFVPSRVGEQSCCKVGIVHEHRFAFYYWALYSHDQGKKPPPVLITLDSHDDIGVQSEVIPGDLDNLNFGNQTELALFAWLRLRSLNDGHILPALYLNFFSDVYVLNKPQDSLVFRAPNSKMEYEDREGNIHAVKFFRHADKLMRDLPPDIPVYLDIDLDYFAVNNSQADELLGSESLLPDNEIKKILSFKSPFMKLLLYRLIGLTIALEPKYCGGLLNSFHLLDILNREFFNGTLCTHSCDWAK